MKFLILIYGNAQSRSIWATVPQAQRVEALGQYTALDADLDAAGERIASEALAHPSRATRVLVRDGRTMTTDGPYAETKEFLAGFYLVDCADLDRAVAIAARVPEAALGLVEVRPVVQLTDAGLDR